MIISLKKLNTRYSNVALFDKIREQVYTYIVFIQLTRFF